MKDQLFVRFPKEVDKFLNNKYLADAEEIVLPLFQKLDPPAEAEFRDHARLNYHPGDPIDELFHPVWQDEARKMNAETEQRKTDHQADMEEADRGCSEE